MEKLNLQHFADEAENAQAPDQGKPAEELKILLPQNTQTQIWTRSSAPSSPSGQPIGIKP